jgi:large subunit ribosomal protein L32
MAVPKRKTSKAKTRSRRAANWTLDRPARSVCPQCPNCGWYKGRVAVEVN